MKEDEINLAGTPATKKTYKVFLTPSFLIFIIVFIVGILILSFSFILKVNLSSLASDGRRLQGQIAQQELKKDKILIISERLSAARKILATRNHFDLVVSSIIQAIPDNFSIEGVDGNDRQVSVSISSDTLSGFANFLSERIPSITQRKELGISIVTADSFTQTKSGYLLSLTFYLKGH